MKTIVVNVHVDDNTFFVHSPGIGRVHMLVPLGVPLGAGQIFAEFFQLHHKHLLALPADVNGVVMALKNHDAMMHVNYNERFLTIAKQHLSANDMQPSTRKETGSFIDSPMDGMFYLSPSPKDPPFVAVGDEIAPGQTVGLIEVMKSFYPLKYQGNKAAKILDVMVKQATPITCGMKLFSIQE